MVCEKIWSRYIWERPYLFFCKRGGSIRKLGLPRHLQWVRLRILRAGLISLGNGALDAQHTDYSTFRLFSCKKDGCAHQIFWKDSLRSTKILVCGHKMYQLLQNTLAPVNFFWLNILKGTTKACPVNLLMLNTPRGTKTAFLTPKTEIINHIVI